MLMRIIVILVLMRIATHYRSIVMNLYLLQSLPFHCTESLSSYSHYRSNCNESLSSYSHYRSIVMNPYLPYGALYG